jgi:hypothetical protein
LSFIIFRYQFVSHRDVGAALEKMIDVRLQIVPAGYVASLEEKIDRDLDAHMRVAGLAPRKPVPPRQRPSVLVEDEARHLGHGIVHVHDSHLDAELVAPDPELEVADARPGEGEHGDWDGAAVARFPVEPELGEAVPEEQRKRAAMLCPESVMLTS